MTHPLAHRMKAARVLADLTQTELAERLGVGLATIQRREYGSTQVTKEQLMALAQATDVPLAWLVEGFSDQQKSQPLSVTLQRPLLPDPPLGLGSE